MEKILKRCFERNPNQKGVHTPPKFNRYHKASMKGRSHAGLCELTWAKAIHRQVLKELKRTPAPNLP